MDSTPKHKLLQISSDAIENIRKIHGLDKPGRITEAITILEEWIQKQDHIIKKDFSKRYLERILISNKGSVEKSKKQIDSLCTMKTLIPKFFSKTNLKIELNNILDTVQIVQLPKLTTDYYRVLMVKVNPKKFTSETFMEYYQSAIILAEYIRANDYSNGYIVVYDIINVDLLDLFSHLNTEKLQQYISILIEGYGARLKAIHLLTDSKAIDFVIKTIKQIVSKKIGDRIHVQPTLEDLHKVVPVDMLPQEYGGKEKSIDTLHIEWIEELSSEEHVEYMKMMSMARTDESRRVSSKFNEEYMGMPGTFRSLSVD